MNTSAADLDAALCGIDSSLRTRLIDAYLQVKQAFAEGQYDACGLRSGKFCEIVLRILQCELTGTSIPIGTKIPNVTDECRKLEDAQDRWAGDAARNRATGDRLRVHAAQQARHRARRR